mmetsp:Transcript_145380/g.465801  ORF Transcript_145380/g.465801 Transcript_145380/m.465801 type:complete len:184 (+) Transcript_145380:67-618(+)
MSWGGGPKKRSGHMEAWDKLYAKAEKEKSGMKIENPQDTLRKMYDKLVQPALNKRGANVPLPTEESLETEAEEKSKAKAKKLEKQKKEEKKKAKKDKAKQKKKEATSKAKKKKKKKKSKKKESSSSSSDGGGSSSEGSGGSSSSSAASSSAKKEHWRWVAWPTSTSPAPPRARLARQSAWGRL